MEPLVSLVQHILSLRKCAVNFLESNDRGGREEGAKVTDLLAPEAEVMM